MDSKTIATLRTISHAIRVARSEGLTSHSDIERRIQDDDMLGRDLTSGERNHVRAWFDLPAEVTETELCA